MYNLKWFKPIEFNMATPSCSIADMDEVFLRKLDEARDNAGVPFIINSAYRSKKWEIDHGRTGTSSHTKGLAVDIECGYLYNEERYNIIEGLLAAGFDRIGIYHNHIHVDLDRKKKPCVIWIGNY